MPPNWTIEEILAAAEGETSETKGKTSKKKWKKRTIGYTSLSLTITFGLSAAGFIFLNLKDLMTLNPAVMLVNPFLIVGAIDAFITLCLALSVTTIYPFVRFRSALGLGFMALYFYSFGQTLTRRLDLHQHGQHVYQHIHNSRLCVLADRTGSPRWHRCVHVPLLLVSQSASRLTRR